MGENDDQITVQITVKRPVDPYKDFTAKSSLLLAIVAAWFLATNFDKWGFILIPLDQPFQSFLQWVYETYPLGWGGVYAFLAIALPAFGVFALWILIGVTMRILIWQLYLKHRRKEQS